MYFGSVRFFRHMIVGLTLLMILGLATSTTYFAIKANSAEKAVQPNTPSAASAANESAPQEQTASAMNAENSMQTNSEIASSVITASQTEIEYQKLCPDMCSDILYTPTSHPKTAYLTFDDGPSSFTEQVLDVLDQHNIKATFFIVGNKVNKKGESILKRMQESGHTIGVHTYSHVYTDIYASPENYLNDFYLTYQKIYEVTGVRPDIFRFPGGSINSYNKIYYQEIISEMTRRNFSYFDWNVTAADSSLKKSEDIVDYVLSNIGKKSEPIILMHDTKSTTAESVERIIASLKEQGYQFDVLSKSVKNVSFSYPN